MCQLTEAKLQSLSVFKGSSSQTSIFEVVLNEEFETKTFEQKKRGSSINILIKFFKISFNF
jgi:hypothetical protein